MKSKSRFLGVCVVVALALTAVLVVIKAGATGEQSWIPNMVGTWSIYGTYCGCDDVTDPVNSQLGCAPWEQQGHEFVVTQQSGNVFAGYFVELDPEPPSGNGILTGVVLPDRTVSIQAFDQTEFRLFFQGRLTLSGGNPVISGYAHGFDDFGISDPDFDKTMLSGQFQLVRLD